MTYFADLSDYSYLRGEPSMLNVGWLGGEHDFPLGDVDPSTLRKLLILADEPANMMRGWHACEFCDAEPPVVVDAPVPEGRIWLGSGEIHVRGSTGDVYAAPTLVVHYIAVHRYLPPTAFLDAVMST